ncbi:MAG: secretion protein HlyD [Woeseiaceae bacterium]|jgi:HlyD family secretion protein|nr:secretion protein HlyD [Woeseiaceae bacterium]
MKPNPRIVIPVVLLLAGAAAAAYFFNSHEDESALTLYGNVDIREVELGFRVPGRLAAMDVDEGATITAGQRLARIDPQPYEDALAAAEAGVMQAQANVDKLESGARPQEVQQARASVREAEAAFRDAERNFERQQGLVETGASSQRILDAAAAQREATAARLASAREALALAREGFRSEDIAAARANLAAAVARRDQAKTQLDDTELTAPSEGTLLARIREPGSMLMQGEPVYSLSLDKPVYVRAYVAEPDLGRTAPGTLVEVTSDASDKVYKGRIGFVSPRAEFTPKSVETAELRTDLVYRLRIVVTDADSRLRQGMPVTVEVPRTNGGE